MDRKRLAEAPPQVKQIKLLDRIDNLTEMAGAKDDFKKIYAQESLLLAEVLDAGPLTDELVALAQELLGGGK